MKKIVLLCLCSLFVFSLSAQLRISKVTIQNHSETDHINDMGFDFFHEQLPSDHGIDFSQGQFTDEFVQSMHCDNGGLGLELTLDHPSFNHWEWRIGAFYITDKIDAISFDNTMSEDFGNYITLNSSFDEIGLQTAFVATHSWKFIQLYGGMGMHASQSFNNELCVFGSDDTTAEDISFRNVAEVRSSIKEEDYAFMSKCFETEHHFSAHMYFIGGVGFQIKKKVELGLELYLGPGFRIAGGDDTDGTTLSGAQIRAGYIL